MTFGGEEANISHDFHEDVLGRGYIKTGSAADQVNLVLVGLDLLINALV